jgi:hypothetical protein
MDAQQAQAMQQAMQQMVARQADFPQQMQPLEQVQSAAAGAAAAHAPSPAPAPAPKKRKGPGGVIAVKEDDDADVAKYSGCMKLPEVVATLAAEAQVLLWVESQGAYLVQDGPGFERRFNELRTVRGKKVESAAHRPFSRMHTHFVLVKGEKWAGTGSMFKYKESTPPPPAKGAVEASNVSIKLRASSADQGEFTITLQHFLDVTGAGDVFKHAMQARHADAPSSSSDSCVSGSHSPASPAPPEQPASAGFDPHRLLLSSDLDGLPMLERYTAQGSLDAQDVSSLLGTMWDCNSKGDQAYFFMRKAGVGAFVNGAIVRVLNGVLVSDAEQDEQGAGLLMVVSDNNAKWKGEPHPTPQQEQLGHWCCFLGQVPVTVEGQVKCGDFIGPKGDGSGVGVVCKLGSSPVIGVALVNKDTHQQAVIKTMCFAGLNVLHNDSDFPEVFSHVRAMAAEVAELRSQMRAVEKSVDAVTVQVGTTDGEVQTLRSHVHTSVGWLHARLAQMEHATFYSRSAAVPVAEPAGGGGRSVEMPARGEASAARQTEVPELPKGDGEWRYGASQHAHQEPAFFPCGAARVRGWVEANRRLVVLLACLFLVLCCTFVVAKHRLKGKGVKKIQAQSMLPGGAACKVRLSPVVSL